MPTYRAGKVWCDLLFIALREGRDVFGSFFQLAEEIARQKGEPLHAYTNETWRQAANSYFH